jgi:hypothetical protein
VTGPSSAENSSARRCSIVAPSCAPSRQRGEAPAAARLRPQLGARVVVAEQRDEGVVGDEVDADRAPVAHEVVEQEAADDGRAARR